MFCKSTFIFAASFFGTLSASCFVPSDCCKEEPPKVEVQTSKLGCGGIDFLVFADFLYWKTTVSNLPYAVFAQVDEIFPDFSIINQESVEEIVFPFDKGIRLGASAQLDCGFGLLAKWTNFRTSGSTSKTVTLPSIIFAIWDFVVPAIIDSIQAKQFLKLNQMNVDVVKRIPLCNCFTLDSFFGITTSHINQILDITAHQMFDPPSVGVVETEVKNLFKGIGPEFGFQTNYEIKNISLYGKGLYSLLYGKFQLSTTSTDTVDIPPVVSFTHDQNSQELTLVSAFNLAVGLAVSWSKFTFHTDYEFNFWPGQVRVPRIHGEIISKTPMISLVNAKGDVGFHGLTTGISFNF